ncbi:MAG: biotin/lipoyl-binding protein, partial [Actinobacteria bacterium]|nr:biotin/lipoyl-binding protein [Actinomycetota bacterium]
MAVTSPQDGFLSKVNRRPGDRVTKGEILASLDGKELGIERDRFVALRDQAESKLRQ